MSRRNVTKKINNNRTLKWLLFNYRTESYFISIISISLVLFFSNSTNIYGQNIGEDDNITQQIEDLLIEFYPGVSIEFQGNESIVIQGDEEFLLQTEGNLESFWNATDIIRQFGYSLDEITTSGMGTELNPTRFYAVLSLDNHNID
ncbi:MAG: hypothetical protein AB7V56_08085 [Candidatus Nitrosocosmicus sp.]